MRWTFPLLLVFLSTPAWAQDADAYYSVPLEALTLVDGKLPTPGEDQWGRHDWQEGALAYVVLDGAGEALIDFRQQQGTPWGRVGRVLKSSLHVRAPAGKEVTGFLVLPSPMDGRYVKLKFKIAADAQASTADEFKLVKRAYYERLLDSGYAGSGWWRTRMYEATGKREGEENPRNAWRRSQWSADRTYDLVTGGRALAENLQLDRGLPGGKRAEETVAIESIEGVTVKEFEWKDYLAAEVPETDPLATVVPADQYAVFFPSFGSMLEAMDVLDSGGTPFQQAFETRAEDARTRERYETQMCVQASAMARLFGPALVKSVAFTGSDPFLREGTDVAILFEAADADTLDALVKANRLKNAAGAGRKFAATDGKDGADSYHSIVSEGREISSYQARIGTTIVVSNSLSQLRRLRLAASDRVDSMADLDEYRYFRQRYTRGVEHESAFVMLTDAAIRKWSSPRWRIGMSRRVRAAAAMAELEAEHVMELATREFGDPLLPNDFPAIDCGRLTLTQRGVESTLYGNTRFLTPVSELKLTHVTEEEAANYKRWRDGYQSNWQNFFDPIGIQLNLSDDLMGADITVMPLILGTEYRQFIRVAGNSEIRAHAGDPHPGSLFQFVFAFDFDSELGKSFGRTFNSWPGNKPGTNPLRWMGESISLYVDRDPFFAEAMKAEDLDKFMQENIGRFPGAINIDVRNPLIAGMFLAGLKMFVQSAAPNYTKWSTRKHGETEYVRIEAGKDANDFLDTKDLALHYATLKGQLVLALSEDILKKAIDRSIARAEKKQLATPERPWLGKHMALQAHRDVFAILDTLDGGDGYRGDLRERSWKNIPILNEWKRMFPDEDALAMHSVLTGIRLVCSGGGTYVWNDEFKTYESTAFGHPGGPKHGPEDPFPLPGWNYGNFGVDFEKDGIRAKVQITRK